MSPRLRRWSVILQVVFVVTVIGLLVFSIVQTQHIAQERARASLSLSRQNNTILQELAEVVDSVAAAQVDQRRAFRKLARRNEVLHGRDPDEAPDFKPLKNTSSSNPPTGDDGTPADRERTPRDRDQRNRDQEPRDAPREPRRRPRPDPSPSPPPPPDDGVCVPLTNVCVDPGDIP